MKASAAVYLIFGIAFYFLPSNILGYNLELLIKNAPVAVMGASFVAMSSEPVIPTKKLMIIASAAFSGIFLFTSSFFQGLGGALGTSACVTVIITLGMVKIYNWVIRII